MSDDQKRHDLAFVAAVIQEYQRENGHGELVIRIQDGRVILVEETRKRKPPEK